MPRPRELDGCWGLKEGLRGGRGMVNWKAEHELHRAGACT